MQREKVASGPRKSQTKKKTVWSNVPPNCRLRNSPANRFYSRSRYCNRCASHGAKKIIP